MKLKYNILFGVLILFSCQKENMCDCFKITGDETTESRDVSGFKKIEMNNNVDLVITPGKPFSCKVTAGSHLIDLVTTEVEGDYLVIKNKNKCNWVRSFKNKYTVEVSMPHLEYIYYSGSGNIMTTDTLTEDIFSMDCWTASGSVTLLLNCRIAGISLHTGTADITAIGRAGESDIYSVATGPVNAKRLVSEKTYITNFSTNDCYVNATRELGANISLQGNIYYTGDPDTIYTNITGSGKLIKF